MKARLEQAAEKESGHTISPPPPGDLHARPRVPCPTVWAFVTYSGIRRGAEGKKMSAATQDHIYGIAKEENNNKRKKPFSTLRV